MSLSGERGTLSVTRFVQQSPGTNIRTVSSAFGHLIFWRISEKSRPCGITANRSAASGGNVSRIMLRTLGDVVT